MTEKAGSYNVTYANELDFKCAIKSENIRLSKVGVSDYTGPDPSLIRALFEFADWTQTEGADLLRVDVSAIRRWMADREQKQSREIPYSAWCLLLLLSGNTSVKYILSCRV